MNRETPITALSVGELQQLIRDSTRAHHGGNTPSVQAPTSVSALFTVKDLMVLLHRSEAWIQRLILSGDLKGLKVGGDWRVSQEALDDYLLECRHATQEKEKR